MALRDWIKRRRRHKRRGKYRYRPNRRGPAKPLSSGKVYNFKRSSSNIIALDTAAPGQGWQINVPGTAINKTWVFNLSDTVPDYSEFTRLFAYWRIKGVRIQMWLSNNVSGAHGNEVDSNCMIMYTDRNISGENMTTETEFLESQTKKVQILQNTNSRPAVDVYMAANQATQVYNSTVNSDYTYTTPKWISTGEPGTQHYTHSNLITRVDGQQFTTGFSNKMYLRTHYTIYLQCKKVQ